MRKSFSILNSPQKVVLILLLILIPLALCYRLGEAPLQKESPRRALIALEMIYNDNYVAHTELGEYYLKKPPFFNWILAGLFRTDIAHTEFWSRFVSIFSMIMTSVVLFLFGRYYTSKKIALFSSLLFLITGELLFAYSITAEIDLFYSFITFSSLAILVYSYDKGKLWSGFLFFYLLNSIGFLTKGFPTIAFIGITLIVLSIIKRDWFLLIKPINLITSLVFFIPIGTYFYFYSEYNDPLHFLGIVWDRSSKRTVIQNGLSDMLLHIVQFPKENLLKMLPTSIFFLFLFRKGTVRFFKLRKPLFELVIIVFANLLIYWVSPDSKPRYIFMFYPPLIFLISIFFIKNYHGKGWFNIIFSKIIFGLSIMVVLASILIPFHYFFTDVLMGVNINYWLIIIAILPIVYVAYQYFNDKLSWVTLLIVTCFSLKLVYAEMYASITIHHSEPQTERENAERVAELTKGENIYYYHWLDDGDFTFMYYLALNKERVISYKTEPDQESYFIVRKDKIGEENVPFVSYLDFEFQKHDYQLVKFL